MNKQTNTFGNFSIQVGPNQGYVLAGGESVEGQPAFVKKGTIQDKQFIFCEGVEILRPQDFKLWAPIYGYISEAVPFQGATNVGSPYCFRPEYDVRQVLENKLATESQIAALVEAEPHVWEYIKMSQEAENVGVQKLNGILDTLSSQKLPQPITDAYKVAFIGSALSDAYAGNIEAATKIALEQGRDIAQRAVNYGFRAALITRKYGAQSRARLLINGELSDLIHPVHKEHTVKYLTGDSN